MPRITNRVRFTKATIDRTKAVNGRECWLWDTEARRLGLRIHSSGRKQFVFQYVLRGRTRRMTLGDYGSDLTPEQAREKARALRQQVANREDPAAERDAARHAVTVEAFADRYLREHAELHKKPSTVRNDRSKVEAHIKPAPFGNLPLREVTRADVARLHQSLHETPYEANRVLALLSHMFTLAEKWGIRPDNSNPCRHVDRFKEKRRQRFMSAAELAKLGDVLREVEGEKTEHPSVLPAVRLLLFTGARRGEILGLRWEHVNWERQCLDLPDSKTGAKTVHLNPPALEVLRSLRDQSKDSCPWVLPGRNEDKALVGLPHAWERIRERAGLADVRIHDLRHSFASVAASGGSSLPIIGALLGHTQPSTTARYAHLAADPLKEVATRVGERIAAAMDLSRHPAVVLPLKQAG